MTNKNMIDNMIAVSVSNVLYAWENGISAEEAMQSLQRAFANYRDTYNLSPRN